MVGEGKAVFHDFLGMSFLSSESWGATATARHEEASRSTGVVDGIDHGSFSAGSRLLSGHLGLAVAAAAPCSSDPGSERMSCGKWEGIHGGMGALGSNRSVTGEKKRETSTSSLRESLQDTPESSGGIKILEQCQGKKKCSVNSSPFQELKNFLCEKKQSSAKKMMLLIIDEMDYLISKDQAVLYDLFRLPTFPNSHCMLIGISNAIDLTDRFLPKLQSLNCKPLVMTFRAYSKEQILKILQQRLMDLPCQIFQLEALELCARMSRFESKDDRRGRHHDDDVLLGMQPPRPTATCQTSTRPSMGANADFMASKKWERPAFMNSGSAVYSPSRLTHLGSYQNKTSANLSRENTVVPALVSQTPADEGSRTGLKGSSLANLMNNGPSAPAARNTSGQSLSAGSSKFLPGNGVQESSIPASPKCVTSASRQLTIFYAGQAHVFDDIHPTKADAILALAGSNGRSWSTTYSTRPRSTLQSLATEGNVLSVEREKVGNRMTVNSSSGLDMPFELQALLPARTHAGQGNSRLGTNFLQFTTQNMQAAIGGNGHKDRTLMACPSTCSNEGDKETICNSQQLA